MKNQIGNLMASQTGQIMIGAGLLAGAFLIYRGQRAASNTVDQAALGVETMWDWMTYPIRAAYVGATTDPVALSLSSQRSIELLQDEFGPNAMDALTPGGVWDETVANRYREYLRTQQNGATGGW